MPSEMTLNVNLSRDLYRFVKAAVKSGRYTSASECGTLSVKKRKRLCGKWSGRLKKDCTLPGRVSCSMVNR